MLVSPTEPKPLRALGTTSSTPEKYGVDFMFITETHGMVGIQRKELSDFVKSADDGRLAKEVSQMRALTFAIVLLEGRATWTADGLAMWSGGWTTARHHGTLWHLQSQGLWIASTESLTGTISYLSLFTKWLNKTRHSSLQSRSGVRASSPWGTKTNEDWAVHLLQSFEGVGPVQAKRIYDRFGVPLRWTVDELELQQIEGIGSVRAEKIIRSLGASLHDKD